MRVSLTARYVSHPTIDFGHRRVVGPRARLDLGRSATTYHRRRFGRDGLPTVAALRSPTSGFTFRSVGRSGRVLTRRAPLSIGTSRVRRA
jgi:hypothetical protein